MCVCARRCLRRPGEGAVLGNELSVLRKSSKLLLTLVTAEPSFPPKSVIILKMIILFFVWLVIFVFRDRVSM